MPDELQKEAMRQREMVLRYTALETYNRHAEPVELDQMGQRLLQKQPLQLTDRAMLYEAQTQLTEDLQNRVLHLEPVQAETAADGQPQQELKPHKQTFKEKQEIKRQRKEARKHNTLANEASYQAVQQLQDLKQQWANVIETEETQDLYQQGVKEKNANPQMIPLEDKRMIGCYVHGYRKNAQGLPATPEDAAFKEQDEAFLQDYFSKDLRRRWTHLDDMVHSLLAKPITMSMFQPPYIQEHAAEIKILTDRITYFQHILVDPINQPFFDEMQKHDPLRWKYLNSVADQAIWGGKMFNDSMTEIGVDTTDFTYYGAGQAEQALEGLQLSAQDLKERQEAARAKQKEQEEKAREKRRAITGEDSEEESFVDDDLYDELEEEEVLEPIEIPEDDLTLETKAFQKLRADTEQFVLDELERLVVKPLSDDYSMDMVQAQKDLMKEIKELDTDGLFLNPEKEAFYNAAHLQYGWAVGALEKVKRQLDGVNHILEHNQHKQEEVQRAMIIPKALELKKDLDKKYADMAAQVQAYRNIILEDIKIGQGKLDDYNPDTKLAVEQVKKSMEDQP